MIITRFPPSPTGYLHIGSLRTALYAYLFAKKNQGKIILRIEDTDQKRTVEGAEENLVKVLDWAGITFDEGPHIGGEHGPYRQSERLALYQEQAKKLLDVGKAYYCFCTEDRLEALRQKQEASKLPTRYDGHCRTLPAGEVEELLNKKTSSVIRLKVPSGELVVFDDIVRGKVKFASDTIDDQVLLKSDGFPTYHLANVVDDHHMEVTHVIRGEEWLSSTPKHVLLYQAFGWNQPAFAHLPLILNNDRSKLSKRQGDSAVEDYMKKGYQKEELLNFVAFLGWNPGGTREIYSLEELAQVFDVNKVQKGGAIMNLEKLKWFRGIWNQRRVIEGAKAKGIAGKIQQTKHGGYTIDIESEQDRAAFAEDLKNLVTAFLPPHDEKNPHLLLRALYTVRDKILQEPERVGEFIGCYFKPPALEKKLLVNEKMGVDETTANTALSLAAEAFESLENWDEKTLRSALQQVLEKSGLKTGQLYWPLRVALTHQQFSPGAYESAWVLGKEKTISLLQQAMK